MNSTPKRDIVVIGGSAGAIEPLKQLLRALPADLGAAILITLHLGESSFLADILARQTKLDVAPAVDGQPLRHGHVYVAVPGKHLLLHDEHVMLRRGPRENRVRPAVDVLFRSAAASLGPRIVGVVLSGYLDDGTAGLRAIKRCGGTAIVQDPAEAAVPEMPRNALRHVDIDHCVRIAELAPLLTRLVREPAGPAAPIPDDIKLEAAISAAEGASMESEEKLGNVSRFGCPECGGTLWEIEDGDILRYRCHVGHAYTGQALRAAQSERVEETLWSLVRLHRERAELVRRMAGRQGAQNALTARLLDRASEYEEDAKLIQSLIVERNGSSAGSEDKE